jgi:hypothetical protein
LPYFHYVNSLIRDSRPQCVRWVGMEYLERAKLQSEIDWAFNNGSGMVKSTNPSNFATYRGGYRCRHLAIAVRVKRN